MPCLKALSVKVSGDIGSNIGIIVSTGGKIEMDDSLKINVSGTNSKVGYGLEGRFCKNKRCGRYIFATRNCG